MTQKIEVQEYGLFQFAMKVQELFEQGYRMNFDRNEDVPMSYGTLFVANMYREETVPVVEPVSEPAVETVVPEVAPAETPTVARKTAKARAE